MCAGSHDDGFLDDLREARDTLNRVIAGDAPPGHVSRAIMQASGAMARHFSDRDEQGHWTVERIGEDFRIRLTVGDETKELTVEADDREDVEEFARERLDEMRS